MAMNPDLRRLAPYNVLMRPNLEELGDHQVALISGGGSGHEPAHAGYVGAGMLTAAVAGEIFTSPSADSIFAAIRAAGGRHGVLLIIKNYTGDRLNFGVAAEMARAEGLMIESVIVADDVALPDSKENAGRRGLAGTVLIHKIAGAAAAEGKDLPQVASIAQAAADNLATMGFALSGEEVELGLGIHGEPGVKRVASLAADELVDLVLDRTVRGLRLRAGESIAVLMNNLGGLSELGLAIATGRALSVLQRMGFDVARLYAGTFLSSLDMPGLSISVMRVNEERLKLLDAPTEAPAWGNGIHKRSGSTQARTLELEIAPEILAEQRPETEAGKKMKRAIRAACGALLENEQYLTELDERTGDGDLGHNLARAARAIEQELPGIPLDDAATALRALGLSLQRHLGGSSGPLYGVLFLRAAGGLENGWAAAMAEGCNAIGELGGARLGDRTMLDALIPFAVGLAQESLEAGARAAEAGAQTTAKIQARRGRSSYLGERVIGTPDPGAVAAAIWLRAVVGSLEG